MSDHTGGTPEDERAIRLSDTYWTDDWRPERGPDGAIGYDVETIPDQEDEWKP